MPTTDRGTDLAPESALTDTMDYETFVAKLGSKDRLTAEKHVTKCEAEADGQRALLWRRLASALMTLSPFAVKFAGPHGLQFYAQDGKYRMQAFAIDDPGDGQISIYCSDVLEAAAANGLVRVESTQPEHFIVESKGEQLHVERVGQGGQDPPPLFKAMLGWKRKALRIAVPIGASDQRIAIAEALCALSMDKITAATSQGPAKP